MEYHKIETLFERDEKTFVVNPNVIKSPVLGTINAWRVTEKIDGTNIRVMLNENGEINFGGRTDNAQMHADLLQYLIRTFRPERMKEIFWKEEPISVVLYGEGYGAGIQKGGSLYRPDKSFILFDALIGNKWWMERDILKIIAADLAIDLVPDLGSMTLNEIVEFIKEPRPSLIGTAMMEGVVARPIETLFDRRGKRIIIKLKTKDFVAGRR